MKTLKIMFGRRQAEGFKSNTFLLIATAMFLAILAEAVAVLAVLGPRSNADASSECCEKMSGPMFRGALESDRAGIDMVNLFRADTIE